MKPIYKEFNCPQCGEVRYINVNGICFDCRNENNLDELTRMRNLQQNLNRTFSSLKVENYI
jgi:predicted ATP-dependent serine protease